MRHSSEFRVIAGFCALALVLTIQPFLPGRFSSADTSTQNVFGPETFEREQARPQTYARRFTVSDTTGFFLLQIVNGDPDDDTDFDTNRRNRVSEATIALNGATIISEREVKRSVRRYNVSVVPKQGENQLDISLRGNPVSMLSVAVVRRDSPPLPDPTPPQVNSIRPDRGATNVPVTPLRIRAEFSEPIDCDTLSGSSFFVAAGGQRVSGTIRTSGGARYASFEPSAPLQYSTTYTVTLTSDITDRQSNHLMPEFNSVFTTKALALPPPSSADTTPPRVIGLSPSAGSADNQNSVPIVVLFSEPVQANTVKENLLVFADTAQDGGSVVVENGSSFLAVPNAERVDGIVSTSADGRSAVFIPAATLPDGSVKPARLPADSTITLVVLTGVLDLAGNHLDQDAQAGGAQLFSATFSTSAFNLTASPAVARVNPQTASLEAARLAGDEVFISGGFNASNEVNATAEIFNRADGAFRSVSMREGRAEHTTTVLANGQVLITGGIGANGEVLSSAEIFDPGIGISTLVGAMHSPRFGHTATPLPDGTVLIAGGYSSAALDTAEIFVPAGSTLPLRNVFVEIPSRMSAARAYHTATPLPDGSVLIAGGASNDRVLDTAEIFVPAPFAPELGVFVSGSGTGALWNGRMSAPRFHHTATPLANGQVLIAGGTDGSGSALQTAELFTPSQPLLFSSFSPAGLLIDARAAHTATVLPGGSVLIAGGFGAGGQSLRTAELYQDGHFTRVRSPLSDARAAHAAALLSDGTVLLANGEDGDVKLSTAETFTKRR